MIRTIALRAALAAATLAGAAALAHAAPVVGETAPAFTAVDSAGTSHNLSDFAGKVVVLEWTNHQCPYVRKHYDSGNMQALQYEAGAAGVVWLSIISSAPGKQGHVSNEEADSLTVSRDASPAAVLIDATGEVGRLYDAKTTPHMFVIDANGVLVYAGGIDDNNSSDPATIAGATNYVRAALADLAAGQPVAIAESEPYGCSVKY